MFTGFLNALIFLDLYLYQNYRKRLHTGIIVAEKLEYRAVKVALKKQAITNSWLLELESNVLQVHNADYLEVIDYWLLFSLFCKATGLLAIITKYNDITHNQGRSGKIAKKSNWK